MIAFKCKMCGGNLSIQEGNTTCECEFCGTTQTVPTLDDEKKLPLFTRANRLRSACEFDKAAGVYESIIHDFPEEAEAYWGIILCNYGIEYVDDPKTKKKIPTCHRSSYTSIFDDPNFEMVMECSDPVSRAIYRKEAKEIEELRNGIIAVSSKEDPYDIFICYKETDVNGDRTIDSEIAQDTYDALTEKGYRVFFARISLEDKLGQEYEPYIFAALNSAKIMQDNERHSTADIFNLPMITAANTYAYCNVTYELDEMVKYKLLVKPGSDDYSLTDAEERKQAKQLEELKREKERLEREEKQKAAYEKACAAIEEEIQKEIQERTPEIADKYDTKIKELKDERNSTLAENGRNKEILNKQLNSIQEQIQSLGLFKVKRKKELQEEADRISAKINSIDSEQILSVYKEKISTLEQQKNMEIEQITKTIRAQHIKPNINEFKV